MTHSPLPFSPFHGIKKVEVIILLFPILYCILAAVSMAAAAFCVYLYFKRRKRQDLVYDNNAFFLMVFSLLLLGGTVFYLVLLGEWQLAHLPVMVCALCLLGLFSWHNEVIVFDEEGFTRRDFFLRSRRHSYQDFTDCSERVLKQSRKRQEVQTLFYIGDKRFALSRKAVNYDKFAGHVRKYGRDGIDP